MLEQAIVDAEALKEAAVKNAETLVLEKYSDQIKDAVETLLEQDEFTEGPMAETEAAGLEEEALPMPEEMASALSEEEPMEEQSTVMEHIPLAVNYEVDEKIEIPLDKLFEEITKLNETIRFDGDFIDDPQLHEHNLTEVDESALEEMLADDLDEDLEEGAPPPEPTDPDAEPVEEEEISEDALEEIAEALEVDLPGNNPTGWLRTPLAEIELAEEEILALEQDSEIREKMSAMRKAARQLESVNESVTNENDKLQDSLTQAKAHMIKLRDTVLVLDKKLQESSLNNAKLLYQNKALNSNSMNERQKHKLVESIMNAESIEEAKVIFETLNNTVGSTSRKSQPNSLSEAVQKTSSMILSSRKNNSTGRKADPTYNRWKFLAGIDNQ